MSLSITNRGTGGNNTTGTSHTVVPGSNMTVGTLGVLRISLDNAGSAGATAAAPASATDSAGNLWTRRQDGIYDNGAASAGVEVAIYTARIETSLTTGGSLVLTWLSGVSVVAKAWTLIEIAAGAGNVARYKTGNVGTGATTGTPTVTTTSITSGNVVAGVAGVESADTWAGDADTSNGSWTTHQHTAFGTSTNGMAITTQEKITTGTATQTYNPTCTSADTMIAWIEIEEVAGAAVTPGVKALTITKFTPAVSVGTAITPGVKALTITKFAPSIAVSLNVLVTPGIKALTITKFASSVIRGTVITPGVKALATTGFAPAVVVNTIVVPGVRSLTITKFAPTVTVGAAVAVTPGVKALTTTRFAPTVQVAKIVTPGVKSLTITPFAPTVTVPPTAVAVTPGVGSLVITLFAPVVVEAGPPPTPPYLLRRWSGDAKQWAIVNGRRLRLR